NVKVSGLLRGRSARDVSPEDPNADGLRGRCCEPGRPHPEQAQQPAEQGLEEGCKQLEKTERRAVGPGDANRLRAPRPVGPDAIAVLGTADPDGHDGPSLGWKESSRGNRHIGSPAVDAELAPVTRALEVRLRDPDEGRIVIPVPADPH